MLKIKRMTTFFNIIGIMSGTSLDGVDITYVKYEHQEDDKWSFKLVEFNFLKVRGWFLSLITDADIP